MTNREFFTNIINGTLTDAEKEFATAAIAKMDETNAKRKEKVAEATPRRQRRMLPSRQQSSQHSLPRLSPHLHSVQS